MNILIIILLILMAPFTVVFGEVSVDIANAPKPFYQDYLRITPVDLLEVRANWKVDKELNEVEAFSTISFKVIEDGYPMFILNSDSKVLVNGHEVQLVKVKDEINKGGNLYYLNCFLNSKTNHYLEVSNRFKSFSHSSLPEEKRHSHFLPVRYYMHSFTEAGIPTNLQYDHYALELTINYLEDKNLRVFTNGKLIRENSTLKKYIYPKHFTGASFFIDIVSSDKITEKRIELFSKVTNKSIPLTVYSEKDDTAHGTLDAFLKVIELSFHALEDKFGPYPFDSILFKPNNRLNKYSGGAFAGAMSLPDHYLEHMTHELGHSYFGHYFSPANGNDQWIYEGMGNWLPLLRRVDHLRDKNYKNFYNLNSGYYDIWKTFDAHGIGTSLLQTVDAEIRSKATNQVYKDHGLPEVFRDLFVKYEPQTVSTQQFERLLSKQTGIDFRDLFSYYFIGY